jgi:STE24 endopeptidase
MTQAFLILFVTLFILHFALERILSLLNSRHVVAHRGQPPEEVKNAVTKESHARSVEYTLARSRFGHIEATVGAILTALFLFSGWIPWLDSHLRSFSYGEITHGVALILVFTITSSVIGIPMELYETFRIEARFGFNKMTLKTFWFDKLKAFLLMLVIGIPFLFGLLAFIMKTGPWWWLWAALFVMGFQFMLMLLYPLVIAPLFNKFTPLEEGSLKTRLEELAAKCHFATRGIFVMDGSKRSSHSNAYFTGLGKARRIVLFDTLIQQLTIPELSAVLAHEIGHFKKKHIIKMLLLSSLITLVGFYVLSLMIDWPPMYQAFGINAASVPVGILIFSLIGGTFTFWLGPLFHALSRKHEYEADHYAAQETQDAASMENALLKLSEKNLSNLTPHPAFSAYHYSHPTLIERIRALRRNAPPSIG